MSAYIPICNKCGAEMRPTNVVLDSFPTQHQYVCTNKNCDGNAIYWDYEISEHPDNRTEKKKKYRILAICGEAGTGKDTILKYVLQMMPDFHEIISCTSRPIRQGEKEGVNYFYYSYEDFADKILKGEMLESTVFNGWCYGTSLDSVVEDKINVGVFNPAGIRTLLDNPEVDLKVVRMRTRDKERLLRQLNREEDPSVKEIVRRYYTDVVDFGDLDFDYIEIPNERGTDLKEVCKDLLSQVQAWIDQGQK